ncbi:MAG: hypothetical protein AAFX44_18470 [Pseudomonadota bacterium]
MDNQYDDDLSAMLRFGVSEELIGLLDAVATTTCEGEMSDLLKFPPWSIALLRKAVLCRNYGKSLWELAHLIAAVVALDGKSGGATQAVLQFFWQRGQASAATLRHAFREPSESGATAVSLQDTLRIDYPDGEFQIAPSRFPFLAALMEFVTYIDPGIVAELPKRMQTIDRKSVDALAAAMQASTAQFLSDNMQLEHGQRKFRQIIEWLVARDCRAADVDDQTVFDFWLHATEETIEDFKRFNVVARDFLFLLKIVSEGRTSKYAEYAFSLGPDRDAGDVDPERLEDLVDFLEAESAVFTELSEPPLKAISFCIGTDRKVLGPIDAAGPWRQKLPLSIARVETLGAAQNRISQHLRNQSASPIEPLIACDDTPSYDDFNGALAKRREKLELTRDATLHVLRVCKHPEAAAAAVERLSDATRREIYESLGVTEDDAIEQIPLRNLAALALQHPELNAVITGWAHAFGDVNRAGFHEIPDESESDHYGAGLRLLELLLSRLDSYTEALANAADESVNGTPRYDVDRASFASVYARLYGDHHV